MENQKINYWPGEFISLTRALWTIEFCISVSDEEADTYRSLNEAIGSDLKNDFYARTKIKLSLKTARAASQLRDLLNVPISQRTPWIDTANGYSMVDDSVHKEGMQILSDIARESTHAPLIHSRHAEESQSTSTPPIDPRLQRISKIGFNTESLVKIMNEAGIKHTLTPPDSDKKKKTKKSTHPTNQDIIENKEFRGPLAEVLRIAVKKAEDKNRYRSVFSALCDLAEAKPPHPPLISRNRTDNVVLYYIDDMDSPQEFTLANMKSRLRPSKSQKT